MGELAARACSKSSEVVWTYGKNERREIVEEENGCRAIKTVINGFQLDFEVHCYEAAAQKTWQYLPCEV